MCSHSKFMKEMLIIFKEKQSRSLFCECPFKCFDKREEYKEELNNNSNTMRKTRFLFFLRPSTHKQ